MKNKPFLLAFLGLLVPGLIISQQYHSFPVSNDRPLWCIQETITSQLEFEEEQTISFQYYTMYGDTIIGENTFQKVYLLSDTLVKKDNIEDYICCIRESSDSCIYRINKGDSVELKLFDYSLEVDDTVNLDTDAGKMLYELSSKNIVTLNSDIYTEYIGTFNKWIDGIGNTSKGIDWYELPKPAMIDYSYNLRTFKLNDTLIYGENISSYLGNATSLNDIEIINSFSLYPNPIKSQGNLIIDYEGRVVQVSIYDDSGRKVSETAGNDIKSIRLNKVNFNAGIFYVRITDEFGFKSLSKLVIIR